MFLVVAVVRLNLKPLRCCWRLVEGVMSRLHCSHAFFNTPGLYLQFQHAITQHRTTLKLIVIDNLQRKFEQRALQIHHRKLNFSWIYMYMLPGKLARKNNLNSIDDYRWTRRATNSSRLFTLYSFFVCFIHRFLSCTQTAKKTFWSH